MEAKMKKVFVIESTEYPVKYRTAQGEMSEYLHNAIFFDSLESAESELEGCKNKAELKIHKIAIMITGVK